MSQSLDHIFQKGAVDFEWIKPNEIPDYLISQVKDLRCSPDTYRSLIKSSVEDGGMLFGLLNDGVKGFCWCDIDPIESVLWINCYSVDRSYWHTREHIKSLIKLLQFIKFILKLDKARWLTTRPAWYMLQGYKPSKTILMEA